MKSLTLEEAKKFLDKYPEIIKLLADLKKKTMERDKLIVKLTGVLSRRAQECKKLLAGSGGGREIDQSRDGASQ